MSVRNNVPLVIPDQILVDTLNQILTILRNDYNAAVDAGHEDESLLYLLLNNISIGTYELYDNAKRIFITTHQDPKHLFARVSYDHNANQNFPAIFVTLPSENTANNSVGLGEGDQPELEVVRVDDSDEYRAQYTRTYLATYHVVVVCENRNEMLVIYNVLKNLLVACTNHFAMCDLLNLKIGGQDLMRIADIPDRYFKRAITLSFQYNQVAPSLVIAAIYRKIKVYWEPTGTTPPQGPIVIENSDDLSPSSSS